MTQLAMFPERVRTANGTSVLLCHVAKARRGYHGPLAIVRFDGVFDNACGGVDGCTLLVDMSEVASG